MENGCVVVTDGKITSVGIKDKVKIPAGASVIGATGMSSLPGFIDAHFHIDGFDDLQATLAQMGLEEDTDTRAIDHFDLASPAFELGWESGKLRGGAHATCSMAGVATVRPAASAKARTPRIRSLNCASVSDWLPSDSASSGRG